MRKISCFALLAVLCALLLGACSNSTKTESVPSSIPATTNTTEPIPAAPESSPAQAQTGQAAVDYCLGCHSDQQQLIDTADPAQAVVNENVGEGMGGEPVAMEPWQKVLVNAADFPQSIHGLNGCISCHGGVQAPEKEAAHVGVIRNPSQDPAKVCAKCHPDISAYAPHSLHATTKGFWTELDERSMPADHPALQKAVAQSCSSCHATCGDCHVSQPAAAGGGFVNGHTFQRTPTMEQNCAVCHGTRAGNEFMGKNENIPADVHYSQGQMICANCHNSHEVHGAPDDCATCHPGPEASQLEPVEHRLQGVQSPRCESCHPKVSAGQDDIIYHQMHGSKLSCQVCHSVTYTNCSGCHVGQSAQTGQPTFQTDSTFFTFLIGRNPLQSYERPYEYVPVRHVPVARDTFSFYGADLLKNFDKLETWKYATPHNIQRKTPQTESCNACHGNSAVFLTADKIDPDELTANRNVVIEQIPAPISGETVFP